MFWDNIQTIVPRSRLYPYQGPVSQVLASEGLLTPYFVNPDHHIVSKLDSEVMEFLETNEGFNYLVKGKKDETLILFPEKLSSSIKSRLKLDFESGEWFEVDSRFVGFYMTLLANKICEFERMVLLTDDSLASNLSEKARADNQRKVIVGRERRYENLNSSRKCNFG